MNTKNNVHAAQWAMGGHRQKPPLNLPLFNDNFIN